MLKMKLLKLLLTIGSFSMALVGCGDQQTQDSELSRSGTRAQPQQKKSVEPLSRDQAIALAKQGKAICRLLLSPSGTPPSLRIEYIYNLDKLMGLSQINRGHTGFLVNDNLSIDHLKPYVEKGWCAGIYGHYYEAGGRINSPVEQARLEMGPPDVGQPDPEGRADFQMLPDIIAALQNGEPVCQLNMIHAETKLRVSVISWQEGRLQLDTGNKVDSDDPERASEELKDTYNCEKIFVTNSLSKDDVPAHIEFVLRNL